MTKQGLLFLAVVGLGVQACNDDNSILLSNDAGAADGNSSVIIDANIADTIAKPDAASDVASAADAALCPNLTGMYSASFGGATCGDYSPQALKQRIDGNNCKNYFEYDGTAKLGVDGSFTVGQDGSFGPVMLKLGSQQSLCSGTTPSEGVVRLSCNNGACLINFTYVGKL